MDCDLLDHRSIESKLICVVPKKCKEPLFCASGISVVVSVFAACMSVHAVSSRLYDCDARNDTMGYTASVCTADDAFTTARGAFCSGGIEACSRSCPATGFVVMKNRVVLVPSLLAG